MDPTTTSLPEQPVQTIPQQNPPQNNQLNNKKITILLSLVGVVIVGVIILGIVLLRRQGSEDLDVLVPSPTVSQVVLPDPTPTPITGREVLLTKGEIKDVVTEYFSLRLDDVEMGENCADCLNIVEISLLRDGQDAKNFVFFCGGITGRCGEGQKDGEIEIRVTEVLSETSVKAIAYYE